MLYATLAAGFAAVALAAAPESSSMPTRGAFAGDLARAGGAAREAAAEFCFAGLQLTLGGERPVSLSVTGSGGRCGCPDGCSLATFRLNVAGVVLRI